MTDLVKRLREPDFMHDDTKGTLRQAADRIEELTGSRDEWEACAKDYCAEIAELKSRICDQQEEYRQKKFLEEDNTKLRVRIYQLEAKLKEIKECEHCEGGDHLD